MSCVARLNIELKYMIVKEKWRMRLMELEFLRSLYLLGRAKSANLY